ncbi:hypothetical protein BDV28DRAFT_127851 [Aspergillus coremiiformis]|uniref:Uncharacterized protein n=1 Tax=Aspergillus coremiiformis TaxID=138285 RepID=A0A5N6ZEF8_9EURO|nr:hypothetical protein BDV28DRAFT_127851 [Aspergillus coremiiformis]
MSEPHDEISKNFFSEIESASESDDLKTLLQSHLFRTCGERLNLLDPANKVTPYLVRWIARKMVVHVIREFPELLNIELEKLT